MILYVHRQTLLDISREVAHGTLELAVALVVLVVTIQIPLVWSTKIAQVTFNHGHGMVLDVFRESRFHVSHVVTLGATEEFLLEMCNVLVTLDQSSTVRREGADAAFDLLGGGARFWVVFSGGVLCRVV